jgi:hypothetical protein
VRDEKIPEKLATHDVQDVVDLFSLAGNCARAAEGRVWHTPPAPEAKKACKPDTDGTAQGSGNKKKKKKVRGKEKLLTGECLQDIFFLGF